MSLICVGHSNGSEEHFENSKTSRGSCYQYLELFILDKLFDFYLVTQSFEEGLKSLEWAGFSIPDLTVSKANHTDALHLEQKEIAGN